MTNSTQRIVLLTGASLAAIGIATPALAATTPFPPHLPPYPITAATINDLLTISNIGDPAATVNKSLVQLEHLGVVAELTRKQRGRVFSYLGYVAILNEGMALPGGER